MKLVREYIIFEKFIEDSDPIFDMGIGIANKIDNVIKSILLEDEDLLLFTVELDIDNLIIYFNSPKLRETRLILTKNDAINYCNKIVYDKLGLKKLFINPNADGSNIEKCSRDLNVNYNISNNLKISLKGRMVEFKRYCNHLQNIQCMFDTKYDK